MNTQLYSDIAKNINSDDLVLGNMRLVSHIAKKYQYMGLDLKDLTQEGFIGLCRAAELYDANKGKFSSYAYQWIKATIKRALSNKSRTVRVPSHKTSDPDAQVHVQELQPTYQGSINPEIENKYRQDAVKREVGLFLDKLNNRQRAIVEMKFGIECDEMKTSEIAKKLGLTVQAVNSNIRNAMKIMKG